MNISSESRYNLSRNHTDDKRYSKINITTKKLRNFNDITNAFIDKLKKYVSNIKELITKCVKDNKDIYTKYVDDITQKLEKIISNYINNIRNAYDSQYESILRAYEQKIRRLYENIFNLELNKKILEESNKNLLRKEKEYELIKQKTGVIVLNGKIINNSRKENEINILRKENSILKDIIEKQKQENLIIKEKKSSKDKTKINTRLIIKMNNLSLKNKKNTKNLYDLMSPRAFKAKRVKKTNHSHPKSNYRLKSDYLVKINNSLLKSPINKTPKSMINHPSSKTFMIKNIFNSYKKSANNGRSNINYINLKAHNINKKRKISPTKAIKKRVIPKIRKNNCHSLNKKKIYQQLLERNHGHGHRHKSTNPSTIRISVTATQRDINNHSHSKKKNNSESLNKKKINIINSSIIKTLTNRANINNKGLKNTNVISPSNDNMINLISKMKNILGLKKHKINSNSFTIKNNNDTNNNMNNNNINNTNNNYNIKRIIYSKRDNSSRTNNLNVVNNKNLRYNNSNVIKTSNSQSNTKSYNNVQSINDTMNRGRNKTLIQSKS